MKVATYLGSLAQLYYGEGGALQTNATGMCGEHSQWIDHIGVATAQGDIHLLGPSFSVSLVCHEGTVQGVYHVSP